MAIRYGSISKLSGKRRNPYCVRPPVTEYNENGSPIKPKPICYTDTWVHGFAALTAWKAGTYEPGCEAAMDMSPNGAKEMDLVRRILADYSRVTKRTEGLTFRQVYDLAVEWKTAHTTVAESTLRSYQTSIKYLEPLYDIPIQDISLGTLQQLMDGLQIKSGSKKVVLNALRLVYKYAEDYKIVQYNPCSAIKISQDETAHSRPFSEDEIATLWQHVDDNDFIKRIIVMCYTGFRRSAYASLDIHLEERYLQGGIKTAASKNRIVPIHDAILPIVRYLVDQYGSLDPGISGTGFQMRFIRECHKLGIDGVTPHSTRHTFATLCKRYRVPEDIRQMLMGHTTGNITNDVYTHLTPDDLREYVNQICCPSVGNGFQNF